MCFVERVERDNLACYAMAGNREGSQCGRKNYVQCLVADLSQTGPGIIDFEQ